MNMFKPTAAKTPDEYINLIEDPERKSEIIKLDNLIRSVVPKYKPYILSGMLAYGSYHYKGKSGSEGDWMIIGLASQKNYISIYVCATEGKEYLAERYKSKLPKADIGKSCIRIKKSSDIDLEVLRELIKKASEVTDRY